ncbi:MAG: helix-turn-helix transcriptional regulator [Halobacteriovoraceae bacterium]|nr:helix-turn-helix transcriptional regulator [Halobacteriovoraceae bacterium]MCB9063287.1 helix-turn-helix transcriptional regulator [Halobacteriovoraceae bacterium]
MKIDFNSKTNLLYFYFKTGVPNRGRETENEDILAFVQKGTDDIIGYEVDGAYQNYNYMMNHLKLSLKEKLAITLVLERSKAGNSQEEFAEILGIGLSTYKSIEKAMANTGIETLEKILEILPSNRLKGIFISKQHSQSA